MIPGPSFGSEIYGRQIAQLATEKMAQFLNLMNRWETLDWKTVNNIVTVGIFDVAERDRVYKYMLQGIKLKVPPNQVPGLDTLLRGAVGSSIRLAERLGGITALGSMVFEPELMNDDSQYYNLDILIMGFIEGNFGRSSGNPRHGKTNNACLLIERWADKGYIALSNIFKKEQTNKYIYVRDSRELFTMLCDIPRKTPWIFIYDEGGLSYSKMQANTIHSRYMNEVSRIIGKLYGNMLYIDQIPEACPETIQKFSTVFFHAITPGTMYIELKGKYDFKRTLRGFQKTSLPFETRDTAYFGSKTINVEALFEAISGKEDRYQAMEDFLDSKESIPKKR